MEIKAGGFDILGTGQCAHQAWMFTQGNTATQLAILGLLTAPNQRELRGYWLSRLMVSWNKSSSAN